MTSIDTTAPITQKAPPNVPACESMARRDASFQNADDQAALPVVELGGVEQWRAWLRKNFGSSQGVWLVFWKGPQRSKSIDYEDAVREALRVGWIDSLIKRIDDVRYCRKFTPRRDSSKWSDINRKRWEELKAAGLLTPAGLAAAPGDNVYERQPAAGELPDYIAETLKQDAKAWSFFQQLAPGYRRLFVAWIDAAKRPETRGKRIRESIKLLSAGKRLGLK